MNEAARQYLKQIGGRGGAAGRGESKRRSPEHYARIAALGIVARQAKRRPTLADELCKLAKLKEQGFLSEQEFEAAKQKLLA